MGSLETLKGSFLSSLATFEDFVELTIEVSSSVLRVKETRSNGFEFVGVLGLLFIFQ